MLFDGIYLNWIKFPQKGFIWIKSIPMSYNYDPKSSEYERYYAAPREVSPGYATGYFVTLETNFKNRVRFYLPFMFIKKMSKNFKDTFNFKDLNFLFNKSFYNNLYFFPLNSFFGSILDYFSLKNEILPTKFDYLKNNLTEISFKRYKFFRPVADDRIDVNTYISSYNANWYKLFIEDTYHYHSGYLPSNGNFMISSEFSGGFSILYSFSNIGKIFGIDHIFKLFESNSNYIKYCNLKFIGIRNLYFNKYSFCFFSIIIFSLLLKYIILFFKNLVFNMFIFYFLILLSFFKKNNILLFWTFYFQFLYSVLLVFFITFITFLFFRHFILNFLFNILINFYIFFSLNFFWGFLINTISNIYLLYHFSLNFKERNLLFTSNGFLKKKSFFPKSLLRLFSNDSFKIFYGSIKNYNSLFSKIKSKSFLHNSFRLIKRENFKNYKSLLKSMNNFFKINSWLKIKNFPLKIFNFKSKATISRKLQKFGPILRRFLPIFMRKKENLLKSNEFSFLDYLNNSQIVSYFKKKLKLPNKKEIPEVRHFNSFFNKIFLNTDWRTSPSISTLTRFVRVTALLLFPRYRKHKRSVPQVKFLNLIADTIFKYYKSKQPSSKPKSYKKIIFAKKKAKTKYYDWRRNFYNLDIKLRSAVNIFRNKFAQIKRFDIKYLLQIREQFPKFFFELLISWVGYNLTKFKMEDISNKIHNFIEYKKPLGFIFVKYKKGRFTILSKTQLMKIKDYNKPKTWKKIKLLSKDLIIDLLFLKKNKSFLENNLEVLKPCLHFLSDKPLLKKYFVENKFKKIFLPFLKFGNFINKDDPTFLPHLIEGIQNIYFNLPQISFDFYTSMYKRFVRKDKNYIDFAYLIHDVYKNKMPTNGILNYYSKNYNSRFRNYFPLYFKGIFWDESFFNLNKKLELPKIWKLDFEQKNNKRINDFYRLVSGKFFNLLRNFSIFFHPKFDSFYLDSYYSMRRAFFFSDTNLLNKFKSFYLNLLKRKVEFLKLRKVKQFNILSKNRKFKNILNTILWNNISKLNIIEVYNSFKKLYNNRYNSLIKTKKLKKIYIKNLFILNRLKELDELEKNLKKNSKKFLNNKLNKIGKKKKFIKNKLNKIKKRKYIIRKLRKQKQAHISIWKSRFNSILLRNQQILSSNSNVKKKKNLKFASSSKFEFNNFGLLANTNLKFTLVNFPYFLGPKSIKFLDKKSYLLFIYFWDYFYNFYRKFQFFLFNNLNNYNYFINNYRNIYSFYFLNIMKPFNFTYYKVSFLDFFFRNFMAKIFLQILYLMSNYFYFNFSYNKMTFHKNFMNYYLRFFREYIWLIFTYLNLDIGPVDFIKSRFFSFMQFVIKNSFFFFTVKINKQLIINPKIRKQYNKNFLEQRRYFFSNVILFSNKDIMNFWTSRQKEYSFLNFSKDLSFYLKQNKQGNNPIFLENSLLYSQIFYIFKKFYSNFLFLFFDLFNYFFELIFDFNFFYLAISLLFSYNLELNWPLKFFHNKAYRAFYFFEISSKGYSSIYPDIYFSTNPKEIFLYNDFIVFFPITFFLSFRGYASFFRLFRYKEYLKRHYSLIWPFTNKGVFVRYFLNKSTNPWTKYKINFDKKGILIAIHNIFFKRINFYIMGNISFLRLNLYLNTDFLVYRPYIKILRLFIKIQYLNSYLHFFRLFFQSNSTYIKYYSFLYFIYNEPFFSLQKNRLSSWSVIFNYFWYNKKNYIYSFFHKYNLLYFLDRFRLDIFFSFFLSSFLFGSFYSYNIFNKNTLMVSTLSFIFPAFFLPSNKYYTRKFDLIRSNFWSNLPDSSNWLIFNFLKCIKIYDRFFDRDFPFHTKALEYSVKFVFWKINTLEFNESNFYFELQLYKLVNFNDSFGLFLSSDINLQKATSKFLNQKLMRHYIYPESFENYHNYFVIRDFFFKLFILYELPFILHPFNLHFLWKEIQASLFFSLAFFVSSPCYLSTTYLESEFVYLPAFVTTKSNIPLC